MADNIRFGAHSCVIKPKVSNVGSVSLGDGRYLRALHPGLENFYNAGKILLGRIVVAGRGQFTMVGLLSFATESSP